MHMYDKSKVTGESMVPVLYLDLDGTVRHSKKDPNGFINDMQDVAIFDGVEELMRRYKKAGWRIVGVSNQGGVALGHMSSDECLGIMRNTQFLVGDLFDRIMWCPHFPTAEDPEMAVCWSRKPRPGMIIEAALRLTEQHTGEIYPPHLGLMVGDRPEDEGAAENANLKFMWAEAWRTGKHADCLGI